MELLDLPQELLEFVISHLTQVENWRLRSASRGLRARLSVPFFSFGEFGEIPNSVLVAALAEAGLMHLELTSANEDIQWQEEPFHWISQLSVLETLTIRRFPIPFSFPSGMPPSLRCLDLRGSVVFLSGDDPFIELLRGCSQLEILCLGYVSESDGPSEKMATVSCHMSLSLISALCPNLIELSIFMMPILCDTLVSQKLRKLTLTFSDLYGFDVQLPNLLELNLRGAQAVPVALFDGMSRLLRVNLACSDAHPMSLGNLLSSAPRLEALDLCYARNLSPHAALVVTQVLRYSHQYSMLGFGGFKAISEIELLQMCRRAGPRMLHLGIGGCTCVTADVIRQISQLCPNLSNLNAHGTNDTISLEEWISIVADMPQLKELDISPWILEI